MENTTMATAKKTAKKGTPVASKKANKATATAKNMGEQMLDTTEELAEDVLEGGKKVRAMATKTIKETAEKIDFSNSAKKIKSTVKNVNSELKETAVEVLDDVKANSKELRTAAAKLAKNVNKQVKETAVEVMGDVKTNGKELRTAAAKLAKSVNQQVKETAVEVMDDVKENGKELRSAAAKLAKEAVENIHLSERLKSLKTVAQKTNTYALETAEELVDSMAVNGEKWQHVAEKAVKTGLKMAAKQQDFMFSTLEAVKGQLGGGAKRFKKLFSNN